MSNVINVIKSSVVRMWGVHHARGDGKERPLLVSRPVKPKRPRAATSSISYNEYNVKRFMRFKKYKKPITGKQEQLGFDSGLYAPVAFASHPVNERIALEARVLPQQLPAPDLNECIKWIHKNKHAIFPKIHKVKPVTFEEYIRRIGSSPEVKKRLIEAHARLKEMGITADSELTPSQIKKFCQRSSFVKVENLSYHSRRGMKSKAPRLIQGAQPEFVVLVGPFIMALQDLICRRWNPKTSNLVFTSGVSAEKAAEHITNNPGLSGCDDISTFDLDQSEPWAKMFVRLTREWGCGRAVTQLLIENINTIGKTHHGYKYKCKGTRKSGDPFTSLFNTIINITSHLYLYCKWTGKTVREAARSFWMLAQGDDNIFTHSERVKFPWREGMRSLGFDSEAFYSDVLERLEFCSMRLVRTNLGWTFAPKPGRVLSRFGYAINRPKHITANQYMRGVAKGLYANCHFIPPIRSFLDRVLELTQDAEGKEYRPREFLDHQLKVTAPHKPTTQTYFALSENYYWCKTRQKKFESTIKRMEFGDKFPQWVETLLFDKDTDGERTLYTAG